MRILFKITDKTRRDRVGNKAIGEIYDIESIYDKGPRRKKCDKNGEKETGNNSERLIVKGKRKCWEMLEKL